MKIYLIIILSLFYICGYSQKILNINKAGTTGATNQAIGDSLNNRISNAPYDTNPDTLATIDNGELKKVAAGVGTTISKSQLADTLMNQFDSLDIANEIIVGNGLTGSYTDPLIKLGAEGYGFYRTAGGILVAINSLPIYSLYSDYMQSQVSSTGAGIYYGSAGGTIATFRPRRNSQGSGYGSSAANHLTMVISSTQGADFYKSGTKFYNVLPDTTITDILFADQIFCDSIYTELAGIWADKYLNEDYYIIPFDDYYAIIVKEHHLSELKPYDSTKTLISLGEIQTRLEGSIAELEKNYRYDAQLRKEVKKQKSKSNILLILIIIIGCYFIKKELL